MAQHFNSITETLLIMKKHSLALCLLVAGFPFVAQAKDLGTLRIGVEGAYPPFSEVAADGKLVSNSQFKLRLSYGEI